MTYNSIYFVFFFSVFLLIYSMMPGVRARQYLLLAGNIIFYLLSGSLSCLVILLISCTVTYAASLKIAKIYDSYEEERVGMAAKEAALLLPSYKKRAFRILLPALFFVLGILIFVKAGRMFHLEEIRSFRDFRFSRFLAPLGISYYTLSSTGYLLDVYWRKAKAEKDWLLLLVSMTSFLTVVKGPIIKYDHFMKQIASFPEFRYARMTDGLSLMLWGWIKKMIFADRLLIYSDAVFANISSYAGIEVVFAVIANVMCVYADFSGCMDIVRGAGECMGLHLDENFRQPFFSRSAAEFWRRWHITLGRWFRDYVYMPIAMSPGFMKTGFFIRRKIGVKASQITSTALPLLVVWILTGIWHGTGWAYFFWGLYWGLLIILSAILEPQSEKLCAFLGLERDSSWFQLFQMARTFCLFACGRMITALGTPGGFFLIWRQIFKESRIWRLFDGGLYQMGLDQKNFHIAFAGVFIIWIVDIVQSRMKIRDFIAKQPLVIRWLILYLGIAAVVILGIYGSSYDANSFICSAL